MTHVIHNPQEFRHNVRNLFKNILYSSPLVTEEETYQQHRLITNLEIALFNSSIRKARQHKGVVVRWDIPAFVQIYTDHLRTLLYNLNTHAEIRDIVLSGDVSPHDFVNMTHQEWLPSMWKTHIEEKIKRDTMKYNKTIQSSTDMFRCKKCHNNKCTYFEMQTRSADESATVFVNCLTCGKNWRE